MFSKAKEFSTEPNRRMFPFHDSDMDGKTRCDKLLNFHASSFSKELKVFEQGPFLQQKIPFETDLGIKTLFKLYVIFVFKIPSAHNIFKDK